MHIAIDPNLAHLRFHVEAICALLGIQEVTVTVSHHCAATATRVRFSEKQCAAHGYDPVAVLAHELRHVWQYQTGRLRVRRRAPRPWDLMEVLAGFGWGTIWDGEEFDIVNGDTQDEHEALPWERDANEWATEYVAAFGGDLAAAA
jgi:hypothetical protein